MDKIKIKVVAAIHDHIQLQPMYRSGVQNILRDNGIEFVKNKPDVILYHSYKAGPKQRKYLEDLKLPTMIIERGAPAGIIHRDEIHRDNVIGIFKSTSFKDLSLNNYNIMTDEIPEKMRYHSIKIFESFGEYRTYYPPKIMIDEVMFDKVELWYNFAIYDMMKPFLSKKITKDRRKVDINFYGTTQYNPTLSTAITRHRVHCLKMIRQLKGTHNEVSETRVSGKDKYINALCNCRVGISPWGLGEKCYRDFEAIYAGSILLKPDTSFVTDWTNTYDPKENYYIPCEVNFSDLQEKVDYIRDNWDNLYDMRTQAKNKLMKYWGFDIIANQILTAINNSMKRIK